MTRRRSFAFGWIALVGAAMTACQSPPAIAPPKSFNRATRVGFACMGTAGSAQNTIGDMASCGLRSDGTLVDPNYALHAFVLQTDRGEVGAVEARIGSTPTVLDSNLAVPGFTFLPAGESPSDLVVSNRADRASMVYVASRGNREIRAIPTLKFRRVVVSDPQHAVRVFEGAPERIVLSPDQRFLFAAFPTTGALVQIPLEDDGGLGTPRTLSLRTTEGEPRAASSAEPGWERICLDGNRPATAALRTPTRRARRGTAPEPLGLWVMQGDAGQPSKLFASDGALGLIHVFPISDMGAGTDVPISTRAPVSEIVGTPNVPGESGPQRFLYAIDRWDGSLMVIDITPDSSSFGAVVPVDLPASGAVDRIHFPARAVALEVVTPFYDASNPSAGLCTTSDSNNAVLVRPSRLRGVFLMAALSDATVRVVDIVDSDAACRGPQGVCGGTGLVGDVLLASRRHRPRIGTFVSRGLVVAAQSVSNGVASAIQAFGATIGDDVPDLEPLAGCPDGMNSALGDASAPVLCVSRDPWLPSNETWNAAWEGVLPRTGGTGILESDARGLVMRLPTSDACERGVLSADAAAALPEGDPEGGYAGDVLVLTSPPTLCEGRPGLDGSVIDTVADAGNCQVQPQCAVFQRVDSRGRALPVRFPVLEATRDRYRLGPLLDGPLGEEITADRVRACYPGVLTYDLRAWGAWTVASDRSVPRHRIVADSTGTCVADLGRPAIDVLRAFDGRAFDNGILAFRTAASSGVVTARGATYVFGISNAPPDLAVDAGRLVTDLVYVEGDRRLFAVDSAQDGLVSMTLDTFTVSGRVP